MPVIVYIDSENAIRETFAQLLEAGGYRVLQAVTGPYGVEMCREFHPDVVVTTLNPIDAIHEGPDFLAVLREAAPKAAIITVGDNSSGFGRLRPGVSMHLHKPLSFTDLAYAIRSLELEPKPLIERLRERSERGLTVEAT